MFYYPKNIGFSHIFKISILLLASLCFAQISSLEKEQISPIENEPKKETIPQNLLDFPNGPVPKPIGVSAYLKDLLHVNEAQRYFEGVIQIISHWDDERLAFDPNKEGLNKKIYLHEDASLIIKKIWTPQIKIRNLLPQNAVIDRSLTIMEDGHVIEHQIISGQFQMIFHTKSFPFDVQRLPIEVCSENFSVYELDIIQDYQDDIKTGVNDKLSIKGWKNQEDFMITHDKFKGIDDDFYPLLKIEIPIKRNPWPIIISSLLPFFLILSAPSLMLFIVKADIAPLMASILTSILAMIALNFSNGLKLAFLEYNNLVLQCFNIGFAYQFIMLFLAATLFNPKFLAKPSNRFIREESMSFLSWFLPFLLITLILLRVLLTKYNLDFMEIDSF